MYQKNYYVIKDSGTYSNALEAFGLARVLSRILGDQSSEIEISNEESHFKLTFAVVITEDKLLQTKYFEFFQYILTEKKELPRGIINFIDHKKMKENKEAFLKFVTKKPKPTKQQIEDYPFQVDPFWDIISNINKLKVLDAYNKIFLNLHENGEQFSQILKVMVKLYSKPDISEKEIFSAINTISKDGQSIKWNKANALQMLNPQQGKGVNKKKASGINMGSMDAFWLSEGLKIAGCYESMIIKNVKVGNRTWDTKIFVVCPKELSFNQMSKIQYRFRSKLRGSSSIKLDISCLLNYCLAFIENMKELQNEEDSFLQKIYGRTIDNFIEGFYVAYFKKLGTSDAISNLAFLQLPPFIQINDEKDGNLWIRILSEHNRILSGNAIAEVGIGLDILLIYRQFITTGDTEFLLKSFSLYAILLMQELSAEHYYVTPFSETLIKLLFYKIKDSFMNAHKKPLTPIFQIEGFSNFAKAIRNSTIILQYVPKTNRQYEVRYNLAHDLNRKSAYEKEFIEYLMEFASSYNQENARIKERKGDSFKTRSNIKMQDIEELIRLVDEYGSDIIGKLLVAYGYALNRKTQINAEEELVNAEDSSDDNLDETEE
jgi:hypothetical protein